MKTTEFRMIMFVYAIIAALAFILMNVRANASDMDCFNLEVSKSQARASRGKDMPKYYKAKQAIKEQSLFCYN